MPKHERDYIESSGNVFADLGLPNHKLMRSKGRLISHALLTHRRTGNSSARSVSSLSQLPQSAPSVSCPDDPNVSCAPQLATPRRDGLTPCEKPQRRRTGDDFGRRNRIASALRRDLLRTRWC